ncbi:hypothetical protein CANCADRAFT_132319 [Tortispora caseinolytica NRRL Y-17796]|uniref:40S ribosomal protein S12 n=1 Tax=Tortispora caseinolytica NRRL Y-17796 TaxID=767744 RepID=A0A1E4TB13_9ASCO|nr:hypothetical protein CANCADRAFT_132319 [Tortispora caseinolytica NRRL Y-17796]
MSDTEYVEEVIVDEEIDVTVAGGELDVEDCLKTVFQNALAVDGLARGLREASKALSSGLGELCVLCDACTEPEYIKLVEALCNQEDVKHVDIVRVSDAKKLGEWAGLCVLDREGNARKVVGCSCVVITNWGADSTERETLLSLFSE